MTHLNAISALVTILPSLSRDTLARRSGATIPCGRHFEAFFLSLLAVWMEDPKCSVAAALRFTSRRLKRVRSLVPRKHAILQGIARAFPTGVKDPQPDGIGCNYSLCRSARQPMDLRACELDSWIEVRRNCFRTIPTGIDRTANFICSQNHVHTWVVLYASTVRRFKSRHTLVVQMYRIYEVTRKVWSTKQASPVARIVYTAS